MRTMIAAGFSAFTLASSALAGQMPAALILDYSGPPRAGIEAYGEVAPGAEIGLGPRDRMVMLHYGSCRQVAITGGKVSVSAGDVAVGEGGSHQDAGRFCPHEVSLAAQAPQPMGTRMDCVIIGQRKAELGEVEIREGGTVLMSVPAQGFRLISAPAAPEMKPGRTYSLVVRGLRGAELASVPVVAEDSARDKACLLRFD